MVSVTNLTSFFYEHGIFDNSLGFPWNNHGIWHLARPDF